MDNAPALAAAADSSDPRTGLRAVAALRRLLEQLEALQVDNAQEQGRVIVLDQKLHEYIHDSRSLFRSSCARP